MKKNQALDLKVIGVLLGLSLVGMMIGFGDTTTAFAIPQAQADNGDTVPREDCLVCHQIEGMTLPLDNGDALYLTVDPETFGQSIHGQAGHMCVDCHTNITGYPHPDFSAVDRRDVSVKLTQTCTQCHTEAAEEYSMGQHAAEFAQGNLKTALCVDCHSAHAVAEPGVSKQQIALVCQQCHSDVYDSYGHSVHGAALFEEGNPDVPVCTDCHENHDNTGPDDEGYVLFSPQLCASCHADQEMMAKYGINTDVFETYVADFHGTTVVIFEDVAPDQETNKPVCIDCHGVHDILSPDNADSTVMKDNLLVTCQRCHPGATSDFSDAWLGHYPPDLEQNSLVYLVNVFYWAVIPVTMVGLFVFIGSDVFATIKKKVSKKAADKEGAPSNE
ncbi:MAG: cytochrome c3 family protein [Chloroflexota bacterium]